jgi:hypothetical protein
LLGAHTVPIRAPQVLEYCKYHGSPDQQQAAPPKPEADVKRWDAEFIDVDKNTLFDLVLVRGVTGQLLLDCIICH